MWLEWSKRLIKETREVVVEPRVDKLCRTLSVMVGLALLLLMG